MHLIQTNMMKRILLSLSLFLGLGAFACQRAEPVTETYEVRGMTCDACAANIQSSVGRIEGVLDAQVTYKDGKAEVTYDPGKVAPGAIEAAVQGMGYSVERQAAQRQGS